MVEGIPAANIKVTSVCFLLVEGLAVVVVVVVALVVVVVVGACVW